MRFEIPHLVPAHAAQLVSGELNDALLLNDEIARLYALSSNASTVNATLVNEVVKAVGAEKVIVSTPY